MSKKIEICTRCVSDTTMSEIKFDENGVCNFCKLHDRFMKMYPLGNEKQKLVTLLKKLKKMGRKNIMVVLSFFPEDLIISIHYLKPFNNPNILP